MTGSARPVAQLVLSGVIFAVSVAAYVYMDAHGGDTAGLMVLVGPVVAVMFADATQRSRLAPIQETVQKVERQTNGVMDARIRTQVAAALADHHSLTSTYQPEHAPQAPEPAPEPAEPPSAATLPQGFLNRR